MINAWTFICLQHVHSRSEHLALIRLSITIRFDQQYSLSKIMSDIVEEGSASVWWSPLEGELLVTAFKDSLEYYFEVAPMHIRSGPE